MTSAMCVQCSYPTGLGMCLMCQGVLPRSCAKCRIDLPTVWYDIFCLPCAEAEGPRIWPKFKRGRNARPTCGRVKIVGTRPMQTAGHSARFVALAEKGLHLWYKVLISTKHKGTLLYRT